MIPESMILIIEDRLGFKLYDWQKNCLEGKLYSIPNRRGCGVTLTNIIITLFRSNEELNLRDLALLNTVSDKKPWYGPNYNQWFKGFLHDIYDKLNSKGQITRKVIF